MKNHTYMGKMYGLVCILMLLLVGTSGCTSNVEGVSDEGKETDEISYIDHKKIQSINGQDFYTGKSAYLDHVVQTLAENGQYVISALSDNAREKTTNAAYKSDMNIVDFSGILKLKELEKQRSLKSNDPLLNLSSHVRVLEPDGQHEEFELVVRDDKNQGVEKRSKGQLSSKWIALDPDTFYALEDEKGATIWPIQFKAVSATDPADEMEFELYENGDLKRAEGAKRKNAMIIDEMKFVEPIAILEPVCETCSGSGGGSYSNTYVDEVEFLALKKIRLHSTGDGGSAGEIQMYVSPVDDYSKKYGKKWSFVFDYKWGYVNRPLWFDDFSLSGIISQTASLLADPRGTILSTADNVFSGRNTRTFGMDYRIYQTPDVNYSGVDYYFEDMRNWSYIRNAIIGDGYMENTETIDYFPIAPLSTFGSIRLVMADNDSDYPEASALMESTVDHDVWTFNMKSGYYQKLYTQIDADRHLIGKTDDLIPRSGIRKINLVNTERRLLYNEGFIKTKFNDFEYNLVKVRRTVELKPV